MATSPASSGPIPASESESRLYQRVHDYPWSSDQEFQGGLRAILGDVTDPVQVAHLTLRAQCYYFARVEGVPIDFDGYSAWIEARQPRAGRDAGNGNIRGGREAEQELTNGANGATGGNAATAAANETLDSGEPGDSGAAPASEGEAPKPASFADIVQMISEGRDIPGIKEIPDTILEGQSTESTADARRKPWEKSSEEAEPARPSWMTE